MQPVYLWRVIFQADLVSLQEIQPAAALHSLEETANAMPAGAYTTLRTYSHFYALRLADHFDRLEEAGRLVDRPIRLDRARLRLALRLAIGSYAEDQEVRLRLSVELVPPAGIIWIGAEPLIPLPDQAYSDGVKAITCSFVRQNPKAKLSETMAGARELRSNLPADVNEALMLDAHACFLEGLSSNFYVIKAGQLWTAADGVLPGITRQLVLDEARLAGIPVVFSGLPYADLSDSQEAFITSASRAVLPVRQVDHYVIGSGQPGALTRQLARRYADRIKLEIEKI